MVLQNTRVLSQIPGIWEIAEYKGDSRLAIAILTDEPNELVAPYHDRMPLALADDRVDAWFDLSIESPRDESLIAVSSRGQSIGNSCSSGSPAVGRR
jgi:putative SOS response-associated peptidase YedK